MKRWTLLISVLLAIIFIPGCGMISGLFSDKKPSIVINEKSLDITVDAAKAKSLGEHLLASVPQLSTLRDKLERETGKKIQLAINVQSSPDPQGINDLEKNYYFIYVPYSSSDGLIKTYTFLINKDDNKILVFAENGDDTISVEEWVKNVGVK